MKSGFRHTQLKKAAALIPGGAYMKIIWSRCFAVNHKLALGDALPALSYRRWIGYPEVGDDRSLIRLKGQYALLRIGIAAPFQINMAKQLLMKLHAVARSILQYPIRLCTGPSRNIMLRRVIHYRHMVHNTSSCVDQISASVDSSVKYRPTFAAYKNTG